MPKGMKNMRTLLLMIFAALSLSVSAQTITLNGNVKDTTGEPIIGASIVEKGILPMVQLLTWMEISL
mgnify:CR=1 FL=1